jgi:hypothetical protein
MITGTKVAKFSLISSKKTKLGFTIIPHLPKTRMIVELMIGVMLQNKETIFHQNGVLEY